MSNYDHWMRFHVGDYLADTMHLSTFQHGIYVLLIMHYFKRGPLPDDERVLARIAKVPSIMIWRNESPLVMALFHLENGVHLHSRIEATRAEAKALSEKRQEAGKSGAYKRWDMANAIGENSKSHPPARPRARDSTATTKDSPPYGPRTAGTDADADLNDGGGRKGSRANGSNPRATGANPRANGTNLRALDLNPRAVNGVPPRRQRSRNGMIDLILDEMEAEANGTEDPHPDGARVVPIPRRFIRRDDDP